MDQNSKQWYQKNIQEIEKELNTSLNGLSNVEAQSRLLKYGKNVLPKSKQKNIWQVFFSQFLNPLVMILIITGIISIFTNEYIDAIFILLVILSDALLGTFQEWKAEKQALALQNMIQINAKVFRDNQMIEIPSLELVLGDIVHLESGDKVGADLRLVHSANLMVDEAFLTGESIGSFKYSDTLRKNSPITDQHNIVFAGSTILSGRGTGIVTATASHTELGKIANHVNNHKLEKTPLVIRMEKFTKQVSLLVIIVAVIITFVLYLKGFAPREIFFTVVALSISAIPEGLPVSLTIALSIASNRMAKKNVIVKKLNAVESLGSCTVIATDKTGTLTLNEQTAKIILLPNGESHNISGIGYNCDGYISDKNEIVDELVSMGVLNNEANLYFSENEWKFQGDSIDVALLFLGHKANILSSLKEKYPIIGEIPYESEKKYSAVFFKNKLNTEVTVKGSLETVLSFCSDMKLNGEKVSLNHDMIFKQNETLAASGYRVIAFASGRAENFDPKENMTESDLPNMTFLGLIGFIDPIRKEVPKAIETCKQAGIKIIMVTGDHPLTAKVIGNELGLLNDGFLTTGDELESYLKKGEKISDSFIQKVSIFARVTPTQKLAIIESLKRTGEFVAVTGDGVNDAPAMKCAHVGIAMGSGTEVAKETGSLIITDDNFSSITSGIEEGRYAYENIRKVIYMLLSCGISEVLFFILSLIFNMPIPLLALQLLWLNLVTDGIQDVALSFEKGEKQVMRQPPRKTTESIFNRIMIEEILISGFTIGVIVFGFWFYLIHVAHMNTESARSYILLIMVLMQNIHVFNCRSEYTSVFKLSFKSNPLIICGIFATLILQLIVTETPFLSNILNTVPLDFYHIMLAFLLTIPLLIVMELFKCVKRRQ